MYCEEELLPVSSVAVKRSEVVDGLMSRGCGRRVWGTAPTAK